MNGARKGNVKWAAAFNDDDNDNNDDDDDDRFHHDEDDGFGEEDDIVHELNRNPRRRASQRSSTQRPTLSTNTTSSAPRRTNSYNNSTGSPAGTGRNSLRSPSPNTNGGSNSLERDRTTSSLNNNKSPAKQRNQAPQEGRQNTPSPTQGGQHGGLDPSSNGKFSPPNRRHSTRFTNIYSQRGADGGDDSDGGYYDGELAFGEDSTTTDDDGSDYEDYVDRDYSYRRSEASSSSTSSSTISRGPSSNNSGAGAHEPEPHHERIEWQHMLASVLNGEVMKSEKKRLSTTANLRQQAGIYKEIWMSLRAILRSRSVAQEKRFVEEARAQIDSVLEDLIRFEIPAESPAGSALPLDQVSDLLKNVDRVESLYPTRRAMMEDKPLYASREFQIKLDALNAWITITRSLQMHFKLLKDWTGSEDLEVARPDNEPRAAEDPSFIERILKESDLQDTFQKRTVSALNNLLKRAKETMIENSEPFAAMRLPPFVDELKRLVYFPTSLVEEALKLRLEYAKRLNDPSGLMVDQMMDDFRGLLRLACKVKAQYLDLATPAPGWDLPNCIDEGYDSVVTDSLKVYYKLVFWKLKGEMKVYTREPEILENEWQFAQEVCFAVEEGEWEAAEQFCSLTSRLLARIKENFESYLKTPPENPGGGIIKWYTRILQNARLRARKLLRFAKIFMSQFENATEYYVEGENLTHFINALVHTEHFLVFTDTFEHDGVYIIASPTLYDRDDRDDVIQMLIRTCFPQDENNMITSETGEDYLLILSPWQSFMWTGEVVNLHLKKILVDMKPNRVRLVIENANQLPLAKEQFWKSVMGSGIEMVQEARAHIPRVNRELSKIRRTVFKLAELTINSVNMLRGFVGGVQCQDLIEESFSFGSDFGNRAAKFLEPATRAQLELKLVRLAIDWVSFICDDCVPTDRKTFRWAVIALEFAMVMTRGKNILALSEPEFAKLQSKVASCIALLISHFDVLGARSTHEAMKAERERQEVASMDDAEKQLNITMCSTFGTENSLMYVRDEWVRQLNELELRRNAKEQELRLVGKVLDDQRPEDRSLVFLAPSSSSMSFRWQQGKFIGAGTFGSVYLAINLDTSEVMAVKEIRFQDSSSLSALHKSIKEEMKVMQMLHHPNIVRYYGIEVHRDKVYIFMEYCENGSLGSLLEHGGRIEEEVWIANYAYQMLQGLEYLHDNNVVHRDIKPDNILLDGDGTVKFVDFGAAKILAKGQKTMGRTTMNMNVNSLTGTPMYMAPEVITGGDKGRKGSMDIWSLGCCVVEMATGRRPWANLDNEWAVMYHVVMGHPPLPDASQLSEAGLDFLKKCFTRSPMKRPSARELLGHPWIHAYLESMTPNGEDYTSAMMPGGSAQGGGGPGSQHGSENGSIHSTHSIMTRSSLGSLGVLGGSIGINFVPGEGHAGSLPIGARSIASSPGRSLPMPLPRPPMPPREMSMSSRSIRSEGSSRPGSPV